MDTIQFKTNHFQTSLVSCWWWKENPFWFWVTGSNVKVIFYTQSLWTSTYNRFGPITLKLHMKVVDDEMRNWTLSIKPCGYVVQSRSILAHKFWMTRGGTLLISGHRSKINALFMKACWQNTNDNFCSI